MTMKELQKCLSASFFVLLFCGCSIQKIAVRQTAELMRDAAPAFEEESDLILAEQAMAANLKVLEGLLRIDPLNKDLSLLLSQGFGGYAFSFLELSAPVRAKDFYMRGLNFAMNYLVSESDSLKQFRTHGPLSQFETALKDFDEDDVPLLFWAGYNWGNFINLSKDNPVIVSDMGRAEALMKRVIELDETYYYGGAHLFLGVFYGSRSAMLGGNLEKAKQHFEKALHISDKKLLIASYMYARFYAVQTQDERLFNRLLRYVTRAPAHILQEQNLANQVAKVRARRALRRKNEFF